MIIAGMYSFNHGMTAVQERYPDLLAEIRETIAAIDAERFRTFASAEQRKAGRLLYSPPIAERCLQGGVHPARMGEPSRRM